MASSHGTARRLCGVLLLALVFSPVTAPFSTCDLVDLFGGPVSSAGASLNVKTTPDEPSACLGHVARPDLEWTVTAHEIDRATAPTQPDGAFRTPLRI